MTTIIACVISFFFGSTCGLLLGGIAAASARADERAREAALAHRIGKTLLRDFHVVREDDGTEHIVPVEDSSPPAG